MFILFLRSEAKLEAWRPFTQLRSSFPHPSKIDRFVHNDGDRKTEFLSLSLRYYVVQWFSTGVPRNSWVPWRALDVLTISDVLTRMIRY